LIRTLGELPTPAARQAIVAGMTDEAAYVRVVACKSLGRFPDAEGFQSLSQAVASDADLDVRVAAARELGNFREFEAPQALRPALDDRDPALQVAAMQSLEGLTGQRNFRNSVSTWREYLDGGTPTPPPGPSVAEVVKQYISWF
jgi:HEAT repeat protein